MQLFITDFKVEENNIIIENKEITHQMKKVLRMKAGDLFFVQTPKINNQNEISRYQVKLDKFETNNIFWSITKTEIHTTPTNKETAIAIAMPNKRSKAELITQKLSELWINKIYFRPAERSVIKDSKDKKIDRLIKISQEATEQSRWRTLPTVNFIKEINTITQDSNTKIIIFDKSNSQQTEDANPYSCHTHDNILWIIWPEWWLTTKDYQKIGKNYTTQTIGDTILRTETASIIAWRIIKSVD